MQDLSFITTWIDNSLRSIMPGWLSVTVECLLVGVGLLLVYALLALFYIYYERKVCAFFQCRLGPNRVGPWGLLQSFADMFKMLIKEIIRLNHIDRFLFALAPYLVIIASMLAFAVLPWGNGLQIIDFNIGIFFLIAVSSIGVLGILLAGWSSNNKFTLIGSLRSGAQMVSYELSIGLSVITMVCLAGTMSVEGIVAEQTDLWFIFKGHIPAIIAFVIYMIAGTAETNRGPFDLPEAESELTAGYHTEYSGILLSGRVSQPVHRVGCRSSSLLRRLDAAAHSGMGLVQYHHGLYSLGDLVYRQGNRPFLHHHLVQVDIPPPPNRPPAHPRVEIPPAHQYGEPRTHGAHHRIQLAFLIS